MLARDRQTNQFKKVYVKALDSMPVGSEIDFDGQASDIPVGWEEIDDPNSYSTTEKVVGKWIDNKPVYRKVTLITASADLTAGTHTISTGVTNVDTPIKFNMQYLLNTSSGMTWQFAPKPSDDYNVNAYNFKTITGDITYTIGSALVPNVQKIIMIMEYTKTTD